ncbi:DPP IV N-terminal domain-containing protein [Emticicia sp. TH156]|uniref:S9 family peptidase n=1 Tax=Emticicia sp. TH156 TaxID=2067454 RepID=UPI000C778AB8|nr:DPP IV N-terminal domain-containing protein [Emticicia sp. TH156]PLK45428.1 S9 family peptidase [Emticicia sp. TH156]
MLRKLLGFCFFIWAFNATAQPGQSSKWTPDGNGYYSVEKQEIVKFDLLTQQARVIVSKDLLTPKGSNAPLAVRDFSFSDDQKKLLIFTNTKRVWRYETKGDYWVLDLTTKELKKLGASLPEASLMFAKISPDGKKAAYVSKNNIYVEELAGGKPKVLTTTNGTKKLINGTFDWVYEEEFDCRDGFRWSPDSKSIAYWQIDANTIRDFYMINNTDSIYSFIVPVEYPKVGEAPSACRVGVVNVTTAKTTWMKVPGDSRQHYIPRMDWAGSSNQLILQQLNRKQNQSKLMYANALTGAVSTFYQEADEAWVDISTHWADENPAGWRWLKGGKEFIWISEKDGWRHLFRVSADGKKETLITKGNFDVISPEAIDEANGYVYFMASPANATQKYLYRAGLDGAGEAVRISPAIEEGTHGYQISPNGKFAYHSFTNYYTPTAIEWVALPEHQPLDPQKDISKKIDVERKKKSNVEFFRITTEEGIEMDGWIAKPKNFDASKKYPIVFMVYSEPASQTVTDRFGVGRNGLYNGDMAADGYIYVSLDNRGTPAPKGRMWRKSIYRKIGLLNTRDQAMAAKKILEWPYVDKDRVAVHGWSGGGSCTLNLMFQYPEIYKTGISVAAVGNQLTYDNIYQERYMGLPQENREDFIKGSPITYAKNLKGNLLYIHGTGDDNVHYQNAELIVNELIRHNRQFQFMAYPNRSHGIYEGEGTRMHLNTLFTNYLKQYCPPGGK